MGGPILVALGLKESQMLNQNIQTIFTKYIFCLTVALVIPYVSPLSLRNFAI